MLESLLKAKVIAPLILLASTAGCDSLTGEEEYHGPPKIEHTSVPAMGSYDNLKGKAYYEGEIHDLRVSTYIKVRGVWWVKPYMNSPLTYLKDNGDWSTDITTGGVDSEATEISSYLVRPDYEATLHVPPLVDGDKVLCETTTSRK